MLVKNRPLTPLGSAALAPFQTGRKAPDEEPATAGNCWIQVVQELMWNEAPCGVGPAQAERERPSARTPPQKATAFCIEAFPFYVQSAIRLYFTTEQPAETLGVSGFLDWDRRVQGDRRRPS